MADEENEHDRVTVNPGQKLDEPPEPAALPPEDKPAPLPLRSGVRRLVTSSKGFLCVAAIIGVCTMNYLGRIDGERALEFIKWLIGFYVAGVVIEDGVEKFRQRGAGSDTKLDAFRNMVMGAFPVVMEAVKIAVEKRAQSEASERPSGVTRTAGTCRYEVQDGDDLVAIVQASLPPGAPFDLHQKLFELINLMNGGFPGTYWLPGRVVTLPRRVCQVVLKLHPELDPSVTTDPGA